MKKKERWSDKRKKAAMKKRLLGNGVGHGKDVKNDLENGDKNPDADTSSSTDEPAEKKLKISGGSVNGEVTSEASQPVQSPNTKSSKKQEKLTNKKRKVAALANIIESNEKDKNLKSKKAAETESSEVKSIAKTDEPSLKKIKLAEVPIQSDLTDEQYQQLKKDLMKRKSELKNVPQIRLKFFGEKALMTTQVKNRQPLMVDDVQYLLMSALMGSNTPYRPDRWCVFEKANKVSHSVILVIEGLTSYNFMANESLFVKTKGIFEHQLEVVLPKYQKNCLLEELCYVPLTQSHREKLIKKYGSLEAAINLNKDHHLITRSVFPIDDEISSEESKKLLDGETFPRTRLLLSPLQMMIEGYPMPLNGEFRERYQGYRLSRESYKPVSTRSPMFGLDCEMCRTVKAENELARVSIVDENYESIYETLVRPTNKITDYLTPWSGITKEMMEDVTKTLKEVQDDVCNLLPPDAILVGQSLNCDLSAMKLMHPYVIDTSVIFNTTGNRNRKSKLQHLAKTFLEEDIQMNKDGHSSIEDSIASLKLTKLKLSKDIYFGDVALQDKRGNCAVNESVEYTGVVSENGEPRVEEKPVATTLLAHVRQRKKKSAIITTKNSEINFDKLYPNNHLDIMRNTLVGDSEHGIQHHKESSAKKVISKTREVILNNEFNLSHFNIMEDTLNEEDGEGLVGDEKLAEVIPKIDKWIDNVWSSVAVNGLFVVILGGHEGNTNGVTMVRVKH